MCRQVSDKLSPILRKAGRGNTATLTMRESGRSRIGTRTGNGPVIRYEVFGLPPGEQAHIQIFRDRWRVLRFKKDNHGDWAGGFASAEEARQSLEDELAN